MAEPTWEQTPEGANVESAWGFLTSTYSQDLPSIMDQMQQLATNPL